MDGAGRSLVATFYAPGPWTERVTLDQGAAHHAAVKRLSVGDPVRLTGGDGRRAHGDVAVLDKRRLEIECDLASLDLVPAPAHVALWAPVGDRDRMLLLAEKSVELGASAWRSVVYRRSRSVTPRGEGAAFQEKLRLRMVAALEQCGGAWLPKLEPETEAADAIAPMPTGHGILLDGGGAAFTDVWPSIHAPVVLALGPEGGLDPAERRAFAEAGWRTASLGANVLRFETAGIAALALSRALLRST
ncbi:MAG TPA: RsmE family RNA methyltransferase [Gemmatimonadaceae bacterium]|nr:RsmE family RNA methyltransferase [Gemmatimonadaceae bacterium]